MPFVISHLAEKHQRMLLRGTSPPHNVFTRILCFKWACRNTARRNKSLRSISFSKFRKKIRKNAKKGLYKNLKQDSIPQKKPVNKNQPPEQITREQVASSPVLKSDSLIILNEFLFETNSATLKADQFSVLDSIMDFLIEHPTLIVKISGHTDDTGNESHNKQLSTKRAQVVAEYIIGNGVAEGRVSFQGWGSTMPLVPNNTPANRSKNRRVELLIHDKR